MIILGAAVSAKEHQEVLLAVADMVITIFAMESAVLRADKALAMTSKGKQELLKAVVKVVTFELSNQFHSAASRCSAYSLKGEPMIAQQALISTCAVCSVEGLLEAKQLLSQASKEAGKYIF